MNVELPLLGAALALIQFYDAVICAIPIRYITGEFDRLQLSSRIRRALPPIKVAAGVGLLVGLWAPRIGALTAAALLAYFLIALGFHRRVDDPPAKWVNAIGMLTFTAVTLALTYLPAV